jgi:hypothetical protein
MYHWTMGDQISAMRWKAAAREAPAEVRDGALEELLAVSMAVSIATGLGMTQPRLGEQAEVGRERRKGRDLDF